VVRGRAVGWGTVLQAENGRGFDSRRSHWHFSLTWSFRPHYGPGVDSASNRNEYQVPSLERKDGRCVQLTSLPPSCAKVIEILEASTSWIPTVLFRPSQGQLYITRKQLPWRRLSLFWGTTRVVIKSSRAISRVRILKNHNVSGTISVPIIRWNRYRLIPREDFITSCSRESSKSFTRVVIGGTCTATKSINLTHKHRTRDLLNTKQC
jgi:hypothetical protein